MKYASSKVCREGITNKLSMDEMGIWTFGGCCQTLKFSIRKVNREGKKSGENKKRLRKMSLYNTKWGK